MVPQKFDVCIWTKNGERFLPAVLKRVDDVIPKENVGKKIFVDDSSTDKSVEIAKKFGWTVYPNKRGGVSGGFNEALKHVETEYYISIEQDVVLSKDWFKIVSKIIENKDVAVAQGIRIPSHPILGAIYKDKLKNEFVGTVLTSLDNNIWKTDIIREVGGIDTDEKFRADRDLYPKVIDRGYKWIVSHDAVSIHIREGMQKSLIHYRNAALRSHRKQTLGATKVTSLTIKAKEGMKRAIRIAVSQNTPSILVVYPVMCLMHFKTHIKLKNQRYKENEPFKDFLIPTDQNHTKE